MKIKEIIKIIEDDGWCFSRQNGSHRQFKHPIKKGAVTVAGKSSDDLDKGTQKSILRQAGLN
ncbi:MAG TPA: type II toxin-antitoxin system HicA family toxin [Mucilaginibacter sp.]|jgi:predicted RNA binding protein YcfA (HicA-like mRNA interferase family)